MLRNEGIAGVVASILLTALAACTTTDDPRKGGLLSGVTNLASGSYERRLDQKRTTLKAERAEQLRLQSEHHRIEEEQARLSAERQSAEQRLSDLGTLIGEMKRRLSDAVGQQSVDQKELDRLQVEITELEHARLLVAANPGLDMAARQRRIDELETRKRMLEAALLEALVQ